MTVDAEYYTNHFGGTDYADIDRLLIRAEKAISNMIIVTPEGAVQEKAYMDAVCAQAEYMGLCGGIEAWSALVSGTASSVSIGSFSLSQGSSAASSGTAYRKGISADAVSYLETAGLLERRCCVW